MLNHRIENESLEKSKKRRKHMKIAASNHVSGRRQFLLNFLPSGTLLCLGSRNILALTQSATEQKNMPAQHKFLENSEMTFKDVFTFAFQNYYIPCLQNLAEEIGRAKFIEMLKRVNSESVARGQRERVKSLPNNDFATFVSLSRARKNRFVQHVLTDEVVEETERFIRTKITECLWAKTFQEANAADIGFAAVCYPDFAMTSAFNPKIKLIRPTTLMQGHEFCDFNYHWEG